MGLGGGSHAGLTAAVVLASCGLVQRAEPTVAGTAGPGSHTRLANSLNGMRLHQVVERASRRLRTTDCQRLLTEFSDQAGQPLQARLDALGLSGERYLGFVVFEDGKGRPPCMNESVLAYTSPGSRVVRVCSVSFFRAGRTHSADAEAIVIHEMLHTLGLGENPPSSAEITKRVLRQCH
jgi:hypothetical protein